MQRATPSSGVSRWLAIGLICLLFAQAGSVAFAAPHHAPDFPTARASVEARAANFSPGMNLPWWFWFAGPPWDPSLIDSGYSQSVLDGFHAVGIRGVRLPVDFFLLTKSTDRTQLDPLMMAKVDAAIQILLATGFNVILDNHNAPETSGGTDISDLLYDDAFADLFAGYWTKLAARYASVSADRLVFEPLNEPMFVDDPARWTTVVLPDLVAAVRAGAPDHTILLSAPIWSSVDGVEQMRPDLIGDTNVIYNLHFYEPFTMTHQGAGWVGTPFEELGGLPYPSSPELVEPVLLSKDWSDEARWNIEEYGRQAWNRDKVAALIGRAVDWANGQGVVLMATQFGVYMAKSPPVDAARLVRDMRETFEARGVPWMVWSDNGGFGFHREDFTYVPLMLVALGLRPGSIPEPAATLSATRVVVSAPITISASGFPARTTIQVKWDKNTTIRTVTTDSSGRATFTARVPRSTRGDHVLTIRTIGGTIAVAKVITVDPSITLQPASGAAGSTVTVRLNGYSAGETVRIRWTQGSAGFTLTRGVLAGTNGSAAKSVTIPSTAKRGSSTVRSVGTEAGARATFLVSSVTSAEIELPTQIATDVPTATEIATPDPTATPVPSEGTTPEPTSAPTETPAPPPPVEAPVGTPVA